MAIPTEIGWVSGTSGTEMKKFQDLLRTLFQFDCADLDFGIYRILNYKRRQVEAFIMERLPQIVNDALAQYATVEKVTLEQELDQLRQCIEESGKALGQAPFDEKGRLKEAFQGGELGKRYLQVLEKMQSIQVAEEVKTRVYNDLYAFFSRYYEDGDFISKPRRGRVELPYTGHEDAILHWATRDQYYVKTGDRFKAYRFKVGDYAVAFELRNIAPEQNGNAGKKRYFVLAHEAPLTWNEQEMTLTIAFEYRPLTEVEEKEHGKTEQQKPQDSLNEAAVQAILARVTELLLKVALARMERRNGREKSVLRWRLDHFTRRNTADFFIHRDLRGFLRRELDFFIKNEVLLLDELIGGNETNLREHAQRGRVVRQVAEAIIDFLAQVEDFQKKLWEKKKFVVRTEYCLTLDRLPEELWDEALANEAQMAEWRQLYSIDGMVDKSYLKAHPTLVVDTRHFPEDFKWRLLAHFDDLGEALDGLLIKSENWQALNLLLEKYREKVKCIYIDPPYNTGNDEFIYKDRYQHSCWLSMLVDRLALAYKFLHPSGTIGVSIDNNEVEHLLKLMDSVFKNKRAVVTVKRGSVTGPKVINPGVVNVAEYLAIYSKSKSEWKPNKTYKERERDKRYNQFIINREQEPSKWKFIPLLQAFAKFKGVPKTKLKKVLGNNYEKELDQFVLENAEAVVELASLDVDKVSKEAVELKEKSESNPDTIYCLKRKGYDDWYIMGGKRILFYTDRLVTIGAELVQGELLTDIWDDTLPNDLHNEGGVTLKKGKKPEKLVGRLIELATNEGEVVLDFFVGSGTACAAAQKLGRKWIGVDIADVLPFAVRRLKNTLFGERSGISRMTNWKGGGFFAYQQLEEYEDTLNNLELRREQEGQLSLQLFGDEYLLQYMLDFETQGSPCLLNLEMFKDPFAYRLRVLEGDEIVECPVDLVETFNYLLGIQVKKMRQFQDNGRLYRAVLGEKNGKQIVVVWRSVVGPEDNEEVLMQDKTFIEQTVLPAFLGEAKPDRLLVNGACFVKEAEAIEPEFKRLIFAPVGV